MSEPSLEAFLYDENETFVKHLDEFKSLVSIGKENNAVLIHHASRFSDAERIVLYLVGRYLRYKLGKGDPDASNEEIANDLHIKPDVVSARLKDLREQGFVVSTSKAVSRVSFLDIDLFLGKIRGKMSGQKKRDEDQSVPS